MPGYVPGPGVGRSVCRGVQQDARERDSRRAWRLALLQVVSRQEVRTEGLRLRPGSGRAQHRRCRLNVCHRVKTLKRSVLPLNVGFRLDKSFNVS